MANTVWVNADYGRDLTDLIVCLMISQKLHTTVAQTS